MEDSEWLFDYAALIGTIDQFAEEIECTDFTFMWAYTKAMVSAHGRAIAPPNAPDEEALAVAWSQFEDTFDDDETRAIISLAGIIAALVSAVPDDQTAQFHRALEVGFALARGFTEEDAHAQHEEWLEDNPDLLSLIREEEARHRANSRQALKAKLKVIDGGKSISPSDENE